MESRNFDIETAFNKLIDNTFVVYRGVRFERHKEGFCRNGVLCKDKEDMDALIDNGVNHLRNSINRLKK